MGRRAGRVGRLAGRSAWQGLVGLVSGHDLTFASSVAFFALLSLFPLLLLVFGLVGGATADEGTRSAVLGFVLQYFPRQSDFITAQLDAVRSGSLTLGAAGMLLLLWAGLGVFGAITSAVNHAWKVEQPRSFVGHQVVALLMLIAAGLILVAALALFYAVEIVDASWFAGVLDRVEGLAVLRGLVARSATTVLLIIVVGLIYFFVPNTRVRFRDVWPGAVLAGVLWRAALSGFQWYVEHLGRFQFIHGSIAAVVVFLLWVYLSAVVLLYGAEFTAAYAALRQREAATEPDVSPSGVDEATIEQPSRGEPSPRPRSP